MSNKRTAVSATTLDTCIARGIEFLRRSQLPSGEFKVYMSPDPNLERDCVFDSSPFPTALITYSIGLADQKAVGDILNKALRFLRAEMEGPGLWRYWTRIHPSHSTIPPDLDDTVCASFVLRRHDVAFRINQKHILANRTREGIFYTWVTARWPLPLMPSYWCVVFRQWLHPLKQYYFWKMLEPTRHDVDGVVNANVLFYLGERSETRPVIDYLIEIVKRGEAQACDGWYQNAFMFYYALSRNYHAGVAAFEEVRDKSVEGIVQAAKPDGSLGDNVLNTALGACALLYWRSSRQALERAIRFLMDQQGPDGSWPRASLYFSGPMKRYGWGSEELVTGFCLEALLRYRGEAY
jgi:hypothetical protein